MKKSLTTCGVLWFRDDNLLSEDSTLHFEEELSFLLILQEIIINIRQEFELIISRIYITPVLL